MKSPARYRSIFSSSTAEERAENFETYWHYTLSHDGDILESERDLIKKKDLIRGFQENPVRSRRPLDHPEVFYRNYVHMMDDPKSLDRKTLLLTCIYKFARHEWVGISGAWDAIPSINQSKTTTDKISRYHLCEEFCHVRLFHEMFRTMQLDRVEWVPLGKWMQKIYRIFPHLPESLMAPPAFVTELMGITFYQHVDGLLDEIFADEPEARDRIRALLHEIMVDEAAHVGQRRNFIGPLGIRMAKWMVRPLYSMFFNDIPEAKLLFDVDRMIADGLAFDYNNISSDLLARSWVPSYCRAV
jgi:hypothetical protein